jgi:hypothetical protein
VNIEALNTENARTGAETLTTRRFEQGRARVEAAQAGLRSPENVPNLGRPGALSLADLPSMGASRQMDVFDLTPMLQAEAVRDQREEQRFQAQMDLWRRWMEQEAARRDRQQQPAVG